MRIARLMAAFVAAGMLALSGCGGDGGTSNTTPPPVTGSGSKTLSIPPVVQQTIVWCWAATAEMIFRYYGLPSLNPARGYQCGIVAAAFNSTPCFLDCTLPMCQIGAGPVSNMKLVIDQYGFFAGTRNLTSELTFSPLSMDRVVAEIDAGRPILAGISPEGLALPNISQHAVLIVGYEINGSAPPRVVVNDPFPYWLPQFWVQPNPYLLYGGAQHGSLGQWIIPHSTFTSSLRWANTIHGIR